MFRRAAAKVEALLAGEAATVDINAEKPRKGMFEVRVRGGKTVVSVGPMKRPFQALRALDMEDVAEDVKAALSK